MLIKVISIDAGWFELDINRHWMLKNSDFLHCDAPKLLLQALLDVSKEHADVRWLCWQGEPGAEILRIEKDGAAVTLEVFRSEADAFHCAFEGASLQKCIGESLYRTQDRFDEMIRSVVNEFNLYENGNGRALYESEWGPFPQAEYERLKAICPTESSWFNK